MNTEAWAAVASDIAAATGRPFTLIERAALGGGSINAAWRVGDGQARYFVKVNDAARLDMFAAEAAGLRELSAAGEMRVPAPLCWNCDANFCWLVLEHIELHAGQGESAARLGRNLARLHRHTAPDFGWHRDNTIGATLQRNTRCIDWTEFWRRERLGYQLGLAAANGHADVASAGTRLLERLPTILGGHQPPASLLHGDLWGGNAGYDASGEPVIYDPAVYYGDREADIAMTELFGGFPPEFYAAYRAEYPLTPGYARRKTLYNLYHVLNHLNLFGRQYAAQAAQMIQALTASR